MDFNSAISIIYTESRAMVSQYQTSNDGIFCPVLRFKNAMQRIYEGRQAGCRIAVCNEALADARMDLEWLGRFGIVRNDLHDLIVETGNRYCGWEWHDGLPAIDEPLPAYA